MGRWPMPSGTAGECRYTEQHSLWRHAIGTATERRRISHRPMHLAVLRFNERGSRRRAELAEAIKTSVVWRCSQRSWIGPDGWFDSRQRGGQSGVHTGPARASERVPLLTSTTAENGPSTPAGAKGRASSANSANTANSASPAFYYQPETQLAFLVDRLAFVNLYSTPTEMAKFTSNCAYDALANGASLKV